MDSGRSCEFWTWVCSEEPARYLLQSLELCEPHPQHGSRSSIFRSCLEEWKSNTSGSRPLYCVSTLLLKRSNVQLSYILKHHQFCLCGIDLPCFESCCGAKIECKASEMLQIILNNVICDMFLWRSDLAIWSCLSTDIVVICCCYCVLDIFYVIAVMSPRPQNTLKCQYPNL